jgi:hypothetical protein
MLSSLEAGVCVLCVRNCLTVHASVAVAADDAGGHVDLFCGRVEIDFAVMFRLVLRSFSAMRSEHTNAAVDHSSACRNSTGALTVTGAV